MVVDGDKVDVIGSCEVLNIVDAVDAMLELEPSEDVIADVKLVTKVELRSVVANVDVNIVEFGSNVVVLLAISEKHISELFKS